MRRNRTPETEPQPVVEGDWLDQEVRNRLNAAADKSGMPRPFTRDRDKQPG